jgi:hypothetical protein
VAGERGVTEALHAVITTIQPPTPAVRGLLARLGTLRAPLWIVGDRKGPRSFDVEGVRFLPLEAQLSMPYALASALPQGHYGRKNLGYLAAIASGAECLYETDDDNEPLPGWRMRTPEVLAEPISAPGWCNIYRHFSEERIWPRGLPLDEIAASFANAPATGTPVLVRSAVQQGLANGSPDVDAVWRLVMDRPFDFDSKPSVQLAPGTWCPFNSQSTWWWPEAFPLLYLPSYCSFRMTDIWRSFIAQRCLWELGQGVVFHAAEVVQERNQHDLMRDFRDEVPGYQRNRELATRLQDLSLQPGRGAVAENLRACYDALVAAEFFPATELELLDAWRRGLEAARGG